MSRDEYPDYCNTPDLKRAADIVGEEMFGVELVFAIAELIVAVRAETLDQAANRCEAAGIGSSQARLLSMLADEIRALKP